MGKKIFIKTFGCQMNEYDSNRIYDSVKKIGFKKTNDQKDADCFVLNTCHIREKATDKVYHDVGRVKKQFRKLALKYHPDKCKDKAKGEKKFKEIFEAYETIKCSMTNSA